MTNDLRKKFKIEADELKKLYKALSETGEGTAQIALIGVKDHDDDILEAGAFGQGQWATVQPAHDWRHLPLGKALIREEGGRVFADFKLNLDTQAGREWASWFKFDIANGPSVQEWSWGFDPPKSHMGVDGEGDHVRYIEEVTVIEVSPVLRGAGTETGTLEMKGKGMGKHSTATSGDLWSRAENEARIDVGIDADYKAKVYATEDGKFLHHFVDEDGRPGDASIKACLAGIEVLNGERGGITVPDEAKQAVYDHLASHLKDAGVTAPELKAVNSGLKLLDQMDAVIQMAYVLGDAVADLGDRMKGIKDLRAGSGRGLSARKVEELKSVIAALQNTGTLDVIIGQDNDVTEAAFSVKAQSVKIGLDIS